jgi:hypothetical protein
MLASLHTMRHVQVTEDRMLASLHTVRHVQVTEDRMLASLHTVRHTDVSKAPFTFNTSHGFAVRAWM